MKGHKKHHHRKEGGGVNEAAEDKSPSDVYEGKESNVVKEADERKHGGKAMGMKARKHAGHKARKSGGRANSTMNPMSSAAMGTPAKGRRVG